MRAPPPVEYACAPGRFLRGASALLVAAAVAVPLAWALPSLAALGSEARAPLADPVVQLTIAAVGGLLAGMAAWSSSRAGKAGERTLRWDGQDWLLAGAVNGRPDERGRAALMLDLGPWLLVRFLPSSAGRGGATWLAFRMADDLARWAPLRGALWTWRGSASRRP